MEISQYKNKENILIIISLQFWVPTIIDYFEDWKKVKVINLNVQLRFGISEGKLWVQFPLH